MSLNIDTPDWLQKWGSLLIGFPIIGAFVYSSNSLFGPFNPWITVLGAVVLSIIWILAWYFLSTHPPRNRSNRFGIALLITTEDIRMRQRLDNDLVKQLREIIAANHLEQIFELVVATNDQAKRFGPFLSDYHLKMRPFKAKDPPERVPEKIFKPFGRFQKRTNCHFFIWGTLIERQDAELAGEPSYTFHTDAIVVHSELRPDQQKLLDEQFLRWIREFKIDRKAEFQGLRFTANEVFLMANMIIGTAAALAGNVPIALALHERLLNQLTENDPNPQHQALRKHLRKMVISEHSFVASTNALTHPEETRSHIHSILRYDPQNYGAHIQLARLQYEVDRDPKAALETTLRSKPFSEGIPLWRYNIAFLQFANGNYKEGLKTYNKILSSSFEGEITTVREVIEFNQRQFSQKGLLPSLFIVGMLSFTKIGNLPFALERIEEFIKLAQKSPDLSILVSRANSYRQEIMKDMELSENW